MSAKEGEREKGQFSRGWWWKSKSEETTPILFLSSPPGNSGSTIRAIRYFMTGGYTMQNHEVTIRRGDIFFCFEMVCYYLYILNIQRKNFSFIIHKCRLFSPRFFRQREAGGTNWTWMSLNLGCSGNKFPPAVERKLETLSRTPPQAARKDIKVFLNCIILLHQEHRV